MISRRSLLGCAASGLPPLEWRALQRERLNLIGGWYVAELSLLARDVLIVLAEHRRLSERESREAALAWPAAYDEYVFRSEVGTPVDPDNLRRAKRRLMKEAGVPQVSLHDLRHLASSLCIQSGMDPKLPADRVGPQRAPFTLDRYTHLFDEQREASAISVANRLRLNEASTQPQWSSIGRQEATDD